MNRIRDLREDADLKQTELAEKIGIKQKTLSNYEREETEIDGKTAKKIADFFGVTLEYLLGFSSNRTGEDFTKDMTVEEVEKMKEYKELLIAKRKVDEKDKISSLKKNA